MAQSTNDYVNIKTDEEARRRAKLTKTKLGMTWSEFMRSAAETLDPDEETHD